MPSKQLAAIFRPWANATAPGGPALERERPEKAATVERIAQDCVARLDALLSLGLGYLTLERSTPTLSPGELQRLRLATQVRSNLCGVVYVLDEPSAGLHPADTEALFAALDQLKASGYSIFVVEHELDVIRRADWIVDVGPGAGQQGGRVLYSGPLEGLRAVEDSRTRDYLFDEEWLTLSGVTRHNLRNVDARFPLGLLTTVTGVSGSGKSSLVSQTLVELLARHLGHTVTDDEEADLENTQEAVLDGRLAGGLETVKRLVRVDQRPIGRTPRSNLATYTGLFDQVRALFAGTKAARAPLQCRAVFVQCRQRPMCDL